MTGLPAENEAGNVTVEPGGLHPARGARREVFRYTLEARARIDVAAARLRTGAPGAAAEAAALTSTT